MYACMYACVCMYACLCVCVCVYVYSNVYVYSMYACVVCYCICILLSVTKIPIFELSPALRLALELRGDPIVNSIILAYTVFRWVMR